MWCLRTLGVLTVTISIVWSMTLETTSSRYLEGDAVLIIGLGGKLSNSSIKNNVSTLNLSKTDFVNDSFKVSSYNLLATVSSLQNGSEQADLDVSESRKIKNTNKAPSKKKDVVVNNFIRTAIKEIRHNTTKSSTGTGSKQKLNSTILRQKAKPSNKKPFSTPKPSLKLKLSTSGSTKSPTKEPHTGPPKSNNAASSNISTKKTVTKVKPTTASPKLKPKPTIKSIITEWKDSITSVSDLKQNWYEEGVPYPNPMPQVTSSSPPFSISEVATQVFGSSTTENIFVDEIQPAVEQEVLNLSPEISSYSPSEPLQGVPPILPLSEENLESVAVSAAPTGSPVGSNSNPISMFNLDMLPAQDLTRDPSASGCPTVHISSSVLSPLERQGCSDLSLVLNTHYHQNQNTRNPAVNTYDSTVPQEEVVVDAVGDELGNAGASDSITSNAGAPTTYTGGTGSPAGGTGGSGGLGGSGGDGGGNGGFKLPDLKPMFEALGYLLRGLWWLIQKFKNPWLYIGPIILFFAVGFLGILGLFPWWIPFVFLYFSVKTQEPKKSVEHVKHWHKPVLVKHPDGWYWDQQTKTWKDVMHRDDYRRRRSEKEVEDMIDDKIIKFGDKYLNSRGKTKRRVNSRSTSEPLNATIKDNVSNPLLQSTNGEALTVLDVRTPPKVQSQINERLSSKYSVEASHAGVAIPIDEDLETLEESTKKMNFYKLERPTTANGGLSTWILLSGQMSSTSPKPTTKKPSVKPIIMKDDKNNETLILSEKPMKVAKPVFKPRSTTLKPTSHKVSSTRTTTVRINTFSPVASRKPTKLTKVKASLLQNATDVNANTTGSKRTANSTTVNISTSSTTPITMSSTTDSYNVTDTNSLSASLPVEAKNGDQELSSTDEKKKKTSQKRKKNKNKRRKPSKASKEGNTKLKEAESPGTQLYSYLRSEIIPVTVGVSLVGLLVTAGLASYYLQPFAALRRNDPIDRKDTEGSYYYRDDYSNAMPEEEAIGKVIAGMPENSLQGGNSNTYKPPTSRNAYPQNGRYRHIDRRSQIHMHPYGSVEDVKLTDGAPINYDPGTNYNGDKNFVVGSVPKEAIPEVTPAVVPEHGPRNLKVDQKFVVGNIPKDFFSGGASPRNLKVRKRREAAPNEAENEISPEENEIDGGEDYNNNLTTSTFKTETTAAENNETDLLTTEVPVKDTTPHNVFNPNERPSTLFELITELFKLKVKLGLELLQNVTNSVSTYVSNVQTRLDEHFRRAPGHKHAKHTR